MLLLNGTCSPNTCEASIPRVRRILDRLTPVQQCLAVCSDTLHLPLRSMVLHLVSMLLPLSLSISHSWALPLPAHFATNINVESYDQARPRFYNSNLRGTNQQIPMCCLQMCMGPSPVMLPITLGGFIPSPAVHIFARLRLGHIPFPVPVSNFARRKLHFFCQLTAPVSQ